MKTISKRTRDKCMRAIIDFYDSHPSNYYMGVEYLSRVKAVPTSVDPLVVARLLRDMGYVELSLGSDCKTIQLTAKGRWYFEAEADKSSDTRSARRHDWLLAIFSAIGGALVSEPLWNAVHYILERLHTP